MKTLGPFYRLHDKTWLFLLIDSDSIQIYYPGECSLRRYEHPTPHWMFEPNTRHICHVTNTLNQLTMTNITQSSLGAPQVFVKRFNHQSKAFENLEIDSIERRKLLREYHALEKIDALSLANSAENLSPPLSLNHLNLSIGNYPLTPSNRQTLLAKLCENWPFELDLKQSSYIEIARRVLGGPMVSGDCIADLSSQDAPSEWFREQWILPNPFSNHQLNEINENHQKIYARHFVGLLFAQVLKILNASSQIPAEFRQAIPYVLSETHIQRQNLLADELYAKDLQDEFYEEEAPPERFLNLDTQTRKHFIHLIYNLNQNIKDNFKQCIYHDLGQNSIWQYLINFLRKIAYYLNFGRFYQLSTALSELDRLNIEKIYMGLFQAKVTENVDPYQSINDYMLQV